MSLACPLGLSALDCPSASCSCSRLTQTDWRRDRTNETQHRNTANSDHTRSARENSNGPRVETKRRARRDHSCHSQSRAAWPPPIRIRIRILSRCRCGRLLHRTAVALERALATAGSTTLLGRRPNQRPCICGAAGMSGCGESTPLRSFVSMCVRSNVSYCAPHTDHTPATLPHTPLLAHRLLLHSAAPVALRGLSPFGCCPQRCIRPLTHSQAA